MKSARIIIVINDW